MGTRRVKNVGWDDDDRDDGWWGSGDWDWDAGYSAPEASAAKPKAAASTAKAKAAVASSSKAAAAPKAASTAAAPKAATGASKAAAPKAAASTKDASAAGAKAGEAKAAFRPSAVEELTLAIGASVLADRVEKALADAEGRAEDAFLSLLAEEVDAGRWEVKPAAAEEPAKAKVAKAKPKAKVSEAAASAEEASAPKALAAKASGKKGDKAKAKEAAARKPAAEEAAPAESSKEVAQPAEAREPPAEAEEPPAAAVPAADDARPCVNLVVVGHVDAGKSTLMGHLLCLVGTVSSKQLHKFEKESKQIGKASFAFAWVLDEGEDERQRGVTIDVCVKHFTTPNRRFTILDAPGHRDFVPNMLQGAVQADVALLVADVSHFDAGFERGGQTKEHLQLVRSLGISDIIVAVNKLDTCGWSQSTYEGIKSRLHAFITGPECGYKDSSVGYLPLSGFTGENMLERKEEALKWWDGPTLIEALDQIPPPPRPAATGPMRLCISDLYKSGASTCVSGKLEGGAIATGQKVLVLPSGEQTVVKSLQMHGAPVRSGQVGDYMDSVLLPIEPQFANIGGVLCDPKNPVPVADVLQAQILVFDLDIPLMRGQQFMCYLHTETLTATLTKLEKLLVKGKPQDRKPKCLQKGNTAIVQLRVSQKVCVERKPEGKAPASSLSRLVLRDRGRTIAAGIVLDTLSG